MRKLACDFKSQVSTIPPQRLSVLFSLEVRQRIFVNFLMPSLEIGGGGIRTHGNSRYAGFQNQDLKPLGHPSVRTDGPSWI